MTVGDHIYRFVKTEDYFANYSKWQTLEKIKEYHFDAETHSVALTFEKPNGGLCTMLVQIASRDTVRFRFGPDKASAEAFSQANTRSLIMDRFGELVRTVRNMKNFDLQWDDTNTACPVLTVSNDDKKILKISFRCDPFKITVSKMAGDAQYPMLETHNVYFSSNGESDYNIVHSFKKPPNAEYIGFGEHGGTNLSKNSSQINFFNFDNMRYRQVYGRGPFECREPLYHSDPFFMQFNTHPDKDFVGGYFTDNPSQILMDLGYINTNRIMIGTRFWDSDIFFFAGDSASDVVKSYMSFIGTPKLKPRWALGYHQGCYGWESREDVLEAAEAYRKHGIPLDGLHIDVDIQHNYQTFTIDQDKFPNPEEMFSELAEMGIKCSTNITPIISNLDPEYMTYAEGEEKGYFLKDKRTHHWDVNAHYCQDFGGGNEYFQRADDKEGNYNSGKSYIGEVYYGTGTDGKDRGTPGHYADLSRKDVRQWWGLQYEYLFKCGLEMVWQDMTTPCIRPTRGDMRGLPFRMLVNQDYFSGDSAPVEVEAIKVWNLYSYNLHKATYHGIKNLPGRENKRTFIVGRGSFTGMHRFAALWTGDNASEWDFLKINVAQCLSLGMSGQAMGGQDIGGFERGEDWQQWVDPELLIRWTVAGAFLPWFRNHYIGAKKDAKLFQEPYAYQYLDLDKWEIPQNIRYLYKSVLPVCKHYIELRYKLMQLFYDALFENTLNGLPICRPMFLTCESDRALYNDKLEFLSNQFFVRQDLLVAPVLEKQSDENAGGKRDVYLPDGSVWYAFMDNMRPLSHAVEGGTTVRYDAHISDDEAHIPFILPMYVRAGAIIPTIESEQYIGERNRLGKPNIITLNVYPGAFGEYTMYLDDGVSRSSAAISRADRQAKGEYREVQITHRTMENGVREIKVERLHDKYTPPLEEYFFIAVLHDPSEIGAPVSIELDGKELLRIDYAQPEDLANRLTHYGDNAWYYNENLSASFVKIFDKSPKRLLTVRRAK